MKETDDYEHGPEVILPGGARPIVPAPHRPIYATQRRISSSRPSSSESGAGAQVALAALRRSWMVVLPIGILLATIAISIVYMTFEPKYEASATLRIVERPQYIAFASNSGDRSKAFANTERDLIRHSVVLGQVVSNPEIAKIPELQKQLDQIAWLKKEIKVLSSGESELFQIVYAGPNGANAAKIVNEVAKAYFKLYDQKDAESAETMVGLLKQMLEKRKNDIVGLREDIRRLAKQTPGFDIATMKSVTDSSHMRPLDELQTRIITTEVDQQFLEAKVKAIEESERNELASDVPSSLVEQKIEENSEIQWLKTDILVKRKAVQEMLSFAKEKKNPSYDLLLSQIKADEKAIEEKRNLLRKQLESDLKLFATNKRKEELEKLRSELNTQKIISDLLKERYQVESGKVKQQTGDTFELEFKRAELERAEQGYALIAKRSVELDTEKNAPARVSLIQEALVPTVPVEAYPYKNLALAGLVGLCLPFLVVVGREHLLRRVVDADQLANDSRMNVVGEIVRLPTRTSGPKRSVGGRLAEKLQFYAESVDSLRTGLLLTENLRDMKVLAITSAVKKEGKTSLAAQLAISLSHASGQMTLLIDGDMRSPDVHRLFNVRITPGLAEVLSHQLTLEAAIVGSWNPCLHLLSAGKLQASPHRLLGNGALKSLLNEALQRYRYVVIDTPPILAASESLVLARHADATLVCTMRDVSRVAQVKKAYERLLEAGAQPIGAVLNGVPAHQYAYRYGTYASMES